MAQINEILSQKGDQVLSVSPDATVHEAVEKMVEHNIGSLLVSDGKGVAGIFTERDCLRRVLLPGRSPRETKVREVMTDRVVCVDRGRSVQECMAIMTQERIRHLPVTDGSRLAGMVSIGDLVRHLSQEQEVELRYLNAYIAGRYPG
jgi:CBS domain-containing protein